MNKHSSIEILEARIAPATFAVTDGGNTGANTLRQAIINANATAGHDTIDLEVDDIEITTALPAITEDVTISSNDDAAVISGNANTVNINGLTFTGMSTGSILRDFTMQDFRGDMITLSNGGGNTMSDVVFFASGEVAGTARSLVITSPNNDIDGNFFQNDGTQAIYNATIDLQGGLYRDLTVKGGISDLDFSAYTLGSLKVSHDVMNSDFTAGRGAIGSITVGGSILDTGDGSGIHAATTIGAIVVKHDIASTGMGRISITAGGLLHPAVADTSLTIASLKTGGDVTHADILAGYDAQLDPVNRSVHVGALAIGGNWMGSNAVAGAESGADTFFGTGDDLAIADGTVGNLSRIASIVIKGTVTGGSGAQYGFVAEQIGSFKFGKTTLPLTNGQDDLAVGSATDVHVLEV